MLRDIFSNASLVIAMRLHALILSIVSQCPTVGLSYDPKVEAAARTAEAPWLDLVQLPSLERVLVQWSECMSHAPSKSHLTKDSRTSLYPRTNTQNRTWKIIISHS